jgi:hypothetical protein
MWIWISDQIRQEQTWPIVTAFVDQRKHFLGGMLCRKDAHAIPSIVPEYQTAFLDYRRSHKHDASGGIADHALFGQQGIHGDRADTI